MSDKPKRRKVHFDSIAEVVADAEKLASGDVETTGHYSYGQILDHLARTMDTVTGEVIPEKIGLPMQIAARFAKGYVIKNGLPAGYKLPAKSQSLLWATEEVNVASGMRNLQQAIERFERTEPLKPHPVFGNLSREQHIQMQCRHSELHLSFVHPAK